MWLGRLLAVLLVALFALLSRPARAEPLPSVDRICDAAWKRARASQDKAKIFSVIRTRSNPGTPNSANGWHPVASFQELEASVSETAESGEMAVFGQAFVWDLPGHSLVVTMFHTSSSGDWEHFVDYCFRANGTLATVESTLTTFFAANGPVLRIRKHRFDEKGKELWVRTSVYDPKTREPLKNAQFADQDEEIFEARADLPFLSPPVPCLPREPEPVVLSGLLERATFPGRPDYESIADGDEEETVWLLKLDTPVCLEGSIDLSGEVDDEQRNGVRRVQLVFEDGKQYAKFRHLVGHRVRVRGALFGSHTGHHHAPILLHVGKLQSARAR